MSEPRTTPFSSVDFGTSQPVGRVVPDIPARLVDGDAMRIDHEGLNQVINLDIESLTEVDPDTDPSTMWVPIWVETTDEYRRQNYSPVTVLVDWADITGKPSTFPPTVPITMADVTGLLAALAALQATNDQQDALITALETSVADLEARVAVLEG